MIRLIHAAMVMFGISFVAIFSVILLPKGLIIADFLSGDQLREIYEMREATYAFKQPIPAQYIHWMTHMIQGISFIRDLNVSEAILSKLPATIELVVAALLLVWVLSRLIARWPIRVIESLCAAMPAAFLSVLLILIFGMLLHLLPLSGRAPQDAEPGMPIFQRLVYLVMPSLALAIPTVGTYLHWHQFSRQRRLGLNTPAAVVAAFLGNLALVEAIFSWRGVGNMFIDSILIQDWFSISSLLLFMGIIVYSTHLLTTAWIASRKNPSMMAHTPIKQEIPAKNVVIEPIRRFRPALAFLLIVIVLAMTAPIINRYVLRVDPNDTNMEDRFLPPGTAGHLLGTDFIGRDQLARLLLATQTSLMIGAVAGATTTFIAFLAATFAGRFPKIGSLILDTFTLVVSSIPTLAIVAVIASGFAPYTWIIALVIFGWPSVLRGSQAALESMQDGSPRLWLRTSLPVFTLATATMLTLEISLSMLGFGVRPPTPSWGNQLLDFRDPNRSQNFQVILVGVLATVTIFCLVRWAWTAYPKTWQGHVAPPPQ